MGLTGPSAEDMYGHIELTPDELAAAILEGKKKKYFHEKHKDQWEEKEVVINGEKRIVVKGMPT